MDRDFLKKTLLFRGLTEPEVQSALKTLKAAEGRFDRGERVLTAGDLTERMGLVLSGAVTVESNDIWGNRTILSLLGPGEFFAETYALLPGEPLMVDVAASESCRILFLNVGRLMGEAGGEVWREKLLGNLLLITARKNLALSSRSFHISPKTARGRVMAYLNATALQRGERTFDIPFNRQQLADYLNLERTALSKELGRMRREGLIEFRKNRFSVL